MPTQGTYAAAELTPVRSAWAVPILVNSPGSFSGPQPATMGIPFPKGVITSGDALGLEDEVGRPVSLQTSPVTRWKDGSVKWLLVDFLIKSDSPGETTCKLGPMLARQGAASPLQVHETPREIRIETGLASFVLDRFQLRPFNEARIAGKQLLDDNLTQILMKDGKGREVTPRVEHVVIEERGEVRVTLRIEGTFPGRAAIRFVTRLCFFAGTGLVRLRFTIHNPKRARHPGGLWELGDPGSYLIRSLVLRLGLEPGAAERMTWKTHAGLPTSSSAPGSLEIYQDSSGGENWNSKNHVTRDGRIACTFRGYRIRRNGQEAAGKRASPLVSLEGPEGGVAVAIPEFWQQFPKALAIHGRSLEAGLFPEQSRELFEFQGGEQKTQTVWLNFTPPGTSSERGLEWVHQPARVRAQAEWYAKSGAIDPFVARLSDPASPLPTYLDELVSGPKSMLKGREVIDEYGWRNFGELYADHELTHYKGALPLISHYNNQYDVVLGTMLQYLRTGDTDWFDLFDPLARHVIDIDIYHTQKDKASYNGGLFWFTDHYKTAGMCTHRTYSRQNCPMDGSAYGGGPSSAHNFTSGLMYYYYLTGNPQARDAVLGLADWVVNMDDGALNVFGLMDDGPTGSASCTFELDYQGPGRGPGNSINALLDAWQVTGRRNYLDKAETLIRRCIHPSDDVAARDFLNVELRWSYTVFLTSLAKYLSLKAENEEIDFMYAYGRASLLHYALWMVDHEIPYFDQVEKLEYPTEVWAAQELRKSNVLRLAAAHADEPLRSRLIRRGEELADRGWRDLNGFESRNVVRAAAIVLVEGLRDYCCRTQSVTRLPRPVQRSDFGEPEMFTPQKTRVKAQLRSVKGCVRVLLKLANPINWRKAFKLWRSV